MASSDSGAPSGALPQRRALWLSLASVPTAVGGFLWVVALSPLVNAAGDSRGALIAVVRAGYFVIEAIAFGLGAYGVRVSFRAGYGKCAVFGFLGVFLSLSGLMPALTSCRAHARIRAVHSVVEDAVRTGEYPKALAILDRVIGENPGTAPLHALRGDVYRLTGECGKARAEFETALRIAPRQPAVLGALAAMLSTCPDDGTRDGARAVEYGTHACDLTQWRDPRLLMSLASALAEAGRFDDAVRRQEEALALGVPPAEQDEATKRLEAYRAGGSVRHVHPDPPPDASPVEPAAPVPPPGDSAQ